MNGRHYIIGHAPDSVCGVSVYDGRRPTVIVADLPDNPGTSVELSFKEVVLKVCRAFLKSARPADVDWVFQRVNGRLFRVRLWNDGSVAGWGPIDGLEQVIGPDALGRAPTPATQQLSAAVQSLFNLKGACP